MNDRECDARIMRAIIDVHEGPFLALADLPVETLWSYYRAIYRADRGETREPDGWMHICQHDDDCDAEPGAVISAKSKALWLSIGPSGAKWVEHYTIPLYACRAALEDAAPLSAASHEAPTE